MGSIERRGDLDDGLGEEAYEAGADYDIFVREGQHSSERTDIRSH